MKALVPIIRLLLGAAPWAMARGAALSVIVLLMGVALLGLSGWFIIATGMAGLAGLGIAFDVFRPAAGVRFLALGRTAARYGERVLTHDATLRALAALRVMLLARQVHLGARSLVRLRSEAVLTRIVSDVDALDGVVLRLLLPALAGLVTHGIVFAILGWLMGWPVALVILAGYVPAAMLILWFLARRSVAPSDQAERQAQTLRRGVIDMIRDRQSLIIYAGLAQRENGLLDLDHKARVTTRILDRENRNASAGLALVVAAVSAAALWVGGVLVAQGRIGPAVGAIGIFVALALAETLPPLTRGLGEYGKMIGAARRIGPHEDAQAPVTTQPPPTPQAAPASGAVPLLTVRQTGGPGFDLAAGQALVLTGPSGSGKTSLLMKIAGLDEAEGIAVLGLPPADWSEAELRAVMTMVPQRSALIAGTIRDNLLLAADADDAAIWDALQAVDLDDVIRDRGGLGAVLGEGGAGLSGGQARRLTLARGLLKKPRLLLLDEPTEGLDHETADRVLTGIRTALPEAAILAALHRSVTHSIFDICVNT